MKPERWRLLVNLYQQASECEESQRADFLKKACAGDDELRQEVESWLAQEERAQNFIEQPAVHQVARELQNAHSSWFMRPVGPYQVLSLLGAGGMGEVYLARDAKLDRRVALKFLPPENEHDPAYRRRLLLEAKAAAAVDHPYVCKIYAIEEAEGKTFLVLEYVEGRTLKERICEGQVESEEVLRIASEIAEALAEAHFRHVIHRDIKPANIMLTPGGHVKVMDFGVAKYVPGTDRSTPDQRTTGVLIGTPQYMAPEQFLGEPADARSDIFSFGIVLYELASGVHPFGRATPQEIARALINENHRPLALAATGIPEGLNSVVDRMLAKDSRLRYESMQQVWADLRQQQNRIGKSAVRERAIEEEFPVAVLPFMDLSPTGNQEYFCDGIVEELINVLTQIKGLRVASRTSVFRFRKRDGDIPAIAAHLKVKALIEGSVRKSKQRVRILVTLVDGDTGSPLWSEKYESKLADVFKIQDAIAAIVAQKLKKTVPAVSGPVKVAETNFEAYDQYLRGRYWWNRRTEDGLHRSIPYFHNAIDLQPRYPLALAGLADSYATLGLYGALNPGEAMSNARAFAQRALDSEQDSAAALTALACVKSIYDWDWSKAEQDFRKAIHRNPKYPLAHHWYANNLLIPHHRFDEARRAISAAQELDPASAPIAVASGLVSFFERRYLQAIDELNRAAKVDPAFGMVHYFIGQVYIEMAKHDEAIETLSIAETLTFHSPEVVSLLGYAHAVGGNEVQAWRLLEEMLNKSKSRYVSPLLLAQILVGLNRYDEAIEALGQAAQLRSADLIWLGVRPSFDSIRTHPRFRSLYSQIGLPE